MRLIDADKLFRWRYSEYDETGTYIDVMCVKAKDIDNAPTVETPQWIPVALETMPKNGTVVWLCCKRRYWDGTTRQYICDGVYIPKHTKSVDGVCDDFDAEYDEETDEYYLPEGFYERINNWDDYTYVAISDYVTHWMPLPELPVKEAAEDALKARGQNANE